MTKETILWVIGSVLGTIVISLWLIFVGYQLGRGQQPTYIFRNGGQVLQQP